MLSDIFYVLIKIFSFFAKKKNIYENLRNLIAQAFQNTQAFKTVLCVSFDRESRVT